jgi:hypothetical protein
VTANRVERHNKESNLKEASTPTLMVCHPRHANASGSRPESTRCGEACGGRQLTMMFLFAKPLVALNSIRIRRYDDDDDDDDYYDFPATLSATRTISRKNSAWTFCAMLPVSSDKMMASMWR